MRNALTYLFLLAAIGAIVLGWIPNTAAALLRGILVAVVLVGHAIAFQLVGLHRQLELQNRALKWIVKNQQDVDQKTPLA